MSRLDEAMERFSAALDALEGKLARRGETGGERLAGELEAVRAERDRLSAELARLRRDSAALEETSAEVAEKLDAAMGEVRSLLNR